MTTEELQQYGTGKSTKYKHMLKAVEAHSPYLEAKLWARLVTNIEVFMCKTCAHGYKNEAYLWADEKQKAKYRITYDTDDEMPLGNCKGADARCISCVMRFDTHELPTNWAQEKDVRYWLQSLFKYRPWKTFCQYTRRRSYKPDVLGRIFLRIRQILGH